MLIPIALVAGANVLSGLPAVILLNTLVLLPVALLCVYGIGTRIAGRVFGYWAAGALGRRSRTPRSRCSTSATTRSTSSITLPQHARAGRRSATSRRWCSCSSPRTWSSARSTRATGATRCSPASSSASRSASSRRTRSSSAPRCSASWSRGAGCQLGAASGRAGPGTAARSRSGSSAGSGHSPLFAAGTDGDRSRRWRSRSPSACSPARIGRYVNIDWQHLTEQRRIAAGVLLGGAGRSSGRARRA